MPSNAPLEEEMKGWKVEVLGRHGRWILIFYADGNARGSIEVFTEEERDAWVRTTSGINERLGLKE